MLILISIPGVVVTFIALWAERDTAIEKSEERVVNIAKHFTQHQIIMINEVEQLTQFLAKKIAKNQELPSKCPEYFFILKSYIKTLLILVWLIPKEI
ncbi:hypothetical protein P20652_1001 [Pseudoalteromonas sp. BSi20652]|nr:hypothetical protein P20652_1001 [Pseudoalteromonas sp. BSi20652]